MTEEMVKELENLHQQFRRMNKAVNNAFFLEAVFIEYMIMEDYAELILRTAGLWESYLKKRRGHEPAIDSKIRYIQASSLTKKTLLNKYFGDELLDRVSAWKQERCKLIMTLLKSRPAAEYAEAIAREGKELAAAVRSRYASFQRCVQRRAD